MQSSTAGSPGVAANTSPPVGPDQIAPFVRFRDVLAASPAIEDSLAGIDEPGLFVEALHRHAAEAGIRFAAREIEARLRIDPLMILEAPQPPRIVTEWPSPAWLPVGAGQIDGEVWIDWAHFAGRPLAEPFYGDSARMAARRPFNRLFARRMRLADFVAGAKAQSAIAPQGFIFHMSRCGSTLVARMLAALERSQVVSEAPPLDSMVQLDATKAGDARAVAAVRAMVTALGRPRAGEERFFLKLDAWHALALPLFVKAFPDVPWVFLYRDPLEVLASQAQQPGMQVVPGMLPAHVFAIDAATCESFAEFGARAIGAICSAAVDNRTQGRGLLVDYSELPGAVASRILPHFGIMIRDGEGAGMLDAAMRDAKAPYFPFASDSAQKRRGASAETRRLADLFLSDVYRRLEALRDEAARARP